jgi:hypothetical protein
MSEYIDNVEIQHRKQHNEPEYEEEYDQDDEVAYEKEDENKYEEEYKPEPKLHHVHNRRHEKHHLNRDYHIAMRMFLIIGLTFLASTIIELILHFLFLQSSGIMIKYALWLFYLNISIAFMTGGIWHFLAYKTKINCMTGMMMGMTLGMQAGMMIGAVIGATNGFFMGSMAGLIVGVALGTWAGKYSGTTMGALQGMMSGLMGGTMGAMITVMMFSDHLRLFMPFYMIINVAILLIMSRMFYDESVKDNEHVKVQPAEIPTVIMLSLIATVILTGVILFLPRSLFLS